MTLQQILFYRAPGLAEMCVADERFTQTYDAIAPGLATYTHDAVLANADRATP